MKTATLIVIIILLAISAVVLIEKIQPTQLQTKEIEKANQKSENQQLLEDTQPKTKPAQTTPTATQNFTSTPATLQTQPSPSPATPSPAVQPLASTPTPPQQTFESTAMQLPQGPTLEETTTPQTPAALAEEQQSAIQINISNLANYTLETITIQKLPALNQTSTQRPQTTPRVTPQTPAAQQQQAQREITQRTASTSTAFYNSFNLQTPIFSEDFQESLEAKGLTLCTSCVQFIAEGKIGRATRIDSTEISTFTGEIPDGWNFREWLPPVSQQGPAFSQEDKSIRFNTYMRDAVLQTIDEVLFTNNELEYEFEITASGRNYLDVVLDHVINEKGHVQLVELQGQNKVQLTQSPTKYNAVFKPASRMQGDSLKSRLYVRAIGKGAQGESTAKISQVKIKRKNSNQAHKLRFPSILPKTGSLQIFVKPAFWQKGTYTLFSIPLEQNRELKVQSKNNEVVISNGQNQIATRQFLNYDEFTQIALSYNEANARIYINNELTGEISITPANGDLYLASDKQGNEKSSAYYDELRVYNSQINEFCLSCRYKFEFFKTPIVISNEFETRNYVFLDDDPGSLNFEKINELNIVTFKGERIATPITTYSQTTMKNARLTLSPLRFENNELLGEVKLAYYWRQRVKDALKPENSENLKSPLYNKKIPELLVNSDKRVKYEEVQFIAPEDNGRVETDFTAFKTKELWLVIKIPSNAKPGIYSGTLTITTQKRKEINLPVSIQVKNVQLQEDPNSAFGIYYRSILDSPLQPRLANGKVKFDQVNGEYKTHPNAKLASRIEAELLDLKEHGFDSFYYESQSRLRDLDKQILKAITVDFLRIVQRVGIDKRIINTCWPNIPGFPEANMQAIREVYGRQREDVYCYGIDEVEDYTSIYLDNQHRKRLAVIGFKHATAAAYRDVVINKPGPGLSGTPQSAPPEIPIEETLYPKYDMSFYSLSRAPAFAENLNYYKQLTRSPNDARQFTNQIGTYPTEGQRGAGIYGAIGIESYVLQKVPGLLLWITSMKVYWPYVYSHPVGNPFDDNDGEYSINTFKDQLVSYPTSSGKPINTIQLEYASMGITDYKIFWNLENAAANQVNRQCARQVQNALGLARELRGKYSEKIVLSKQPKRASFWLAPEEAVELIDLNQDKTRALTALAELQTCKEANELMPKSAKTQRQPGIVEIIRDWIEKIIRK